MKLAVSNIAWDRKDDIAVHRLLAKSGVTGIEIAPTKIWPDWDVRLDEAETLKHRLLDEGFSVPALQAILFGRPDLQVFGPETHVEFYSHLVRVADLAVALEARVLVFGAPWNRRKPPDIPDDEAQEFFNTLGNLCAARGVRLGIEPVPEEYGCNFLTTADSVRQFIDALGNKGVELHVDSAALHLASPDVAGQLRALPHFCHVHVAEPHLAPIGGGGVDHSSFVKELKSRGYAGWLSIEMRNSGMNDLNTSVQYIKDIINAV